MKQNGRPPHRGSREFARLNDKGLGTKHNQKPISVMLSPELDAWVRSLPNRSEWIREAIRKQYEHEAAADTAQDSEEAEECDHTLETEPRVSYNQIREELGLAE